MSTDPANVGAGEYSYEEREAVAVFDDERALNAAVDELIQAGLRQEDMSLLAAAKLAADQGSETVEELADSADAPRTAFVSSDSRTEGLTALASAPGLVAGLAAPAVVGTGGAALIPTIAATLGSSATGGALGLVLARAFGRKHTAYVEQQIRRGGLILWVHAPDPAHDATILGILKRNGGKDVHIHASTRSWGLKDVPLHDVNPDPFLR